MNVPKDCLTCKLYNRLRKAIMSLQRFTPSDRNKLMFVFHAGVAKIEAKTTGHCTLCLMMKYPPWHQYWRQRGQE